MHKYVMDIFYMQNPRKDSAVFVASLFASTFRQAADMIRNNVFNYTHTSLGSGLIGVTDLHHIRPAYWYAAEGHYYIGYWGANAPEIFMKRRNVNRLQ
jgi:RimJ/RimL family protein N-acetyltransferase